MHAWEKGEAGVGIVRCVGGAVALWFGCWGLLVGGGVGAGRVSDTHLWGQGRGGLWPMAWGFAHVPNRLPRLFSVPPSVQSAACLPAAAFILVSMLNCSVGGVATCGSPGLSFLPTFSLFCLIGKRGLLLLRSLLPVHASNHGDFLNQLFYPAEIHQEIPEEIHSAVLTSINLWNKICLKRKVSHKSQVSIQP